VRKTLRNLISSLVRGGGGGGSGFSFLRGWLKNGAVFYIERRFANSGKISSISVPILNATQRKPKVKISIASGFYYS
jgi:hypothetical protein